MSLEIERKFLLTQPLETVAGHFTKKSEQRIEQTYLALDTNQELRVRRITDLSTGEVEYTHTFKKGNGLSREEIEYSISEGIYTQVMDAFGAIPLTKDRITAQWDGTTIEIDIYDQIQLTVVEVEFESEEQAHAFVAPEWFGPDISDERKYSNKTVWRQLQERQLG
ncbi:CYTH domain-containing protein [Paenibacillus sp. NEAU-GSW1]|uniref:CYTH domain-containing protein n=1 Tax=Paenibacillus sp. NEAU-GSW1 TaxID=2682486 RepID=UPI0012E21F89|nr:CYTH domain-containing protein [Paenibacillus sp. NEAU-GSW1]MUT65749.1 CYTH domain-containing protein [Paenibacillus sp. NEAU-GSW1]